MLHCLDVFDARGFDALEDIVDVRIEAHSLPDEGYVLVIDVGRRILRT